MHLLLSWKTFIKRLAQANYRKSPKYVGDNS